MLEAELRALAARQHGVVSRTQARRLGASRKSLARRLAGPGWEAPAPQVLRLVGTTDTFSQRCLAGVLDLGPSAVISRTAAAALWGLPGFVPGDVHVTRPVAATSRTSRLAVVHESRYLPEHHRTFREAIPLTTVARTVFDLAGCLHPGRTERAMENALKYRLVDLETLRRVTIELLARGRAGSTLMRELLAQRGVGYIPPASGLEADFLALLVAAHVELPEGQVDLGADGWIGRVDFYYRRHRLVIEIDSHLHHTARLDAESDASRDRGLRAAGFEVLRITERQLRERPDQVVAVVRGALAPPHPPEPTPGTRSFCPPCGVRTGGEAVEAVR